MSCHPFCRSIRIGTELARAIFLFDDGIRGGFVHRLSTGAGIAQWLEHRTRD